MDNLEFNTLLRHLGQDVGYMGLILKKDVQKCVNELDSTHDSQKYCQKLTEIFTKLSAYTVEYAKALEERIKGAGKEQEYDSILKSLHQLTCKREENTLNDTGQNGECSVLKLPSNSGDDLLKDISTNVDPVLSQCSSIHLVNEFKEEYSTEISLDENVPVDNQNDQVLEQADDLSSEPKSESSSQLSINALLSTLNNNAQNEEDCNDDTHNEYNPVASFLEVALSEEVISEEQNPTVESQSTDDTFDKETIANSPSRLDAIDDHIAGLSDEQITQSCEGDDQENSHNLDDTNLFYKEVPTDKSTALARNETSLQKEPLNTNDAATDIHENNAKTPVLPEANSQDVIDNENGSSNDSDVLIVGDFPVKIKSELVECQQSENEVATPPNLAHKDCGSGTEIIADSSDINESSPGSKPSNADKSDSSDVEFITCTSLPLPLKASQDDFSNELSSKENPDADRKPSTRLSSENGPESSKNDELPTKVVETTSQENEASSSSLLHDTDVPSNKEDGLDIVAENSQAEIVKTSQNEELTVPETSENVPTVNQEEEACSSKQAVKTSAQAVEASSDSDATVANLTPPRNSGGESDDTVVYEHEPREVLSDEETISRASELSQAFSVPCQSEQPDKDSACAVENSSEKSVEFDGSTKANVVSDAASAEQSEKSNNEIDDTPPKTLAQNIQDSSPSENAKAPDVTPHWDSDVDYDLPTQVVPASSSVTTDVAKVTENSGTKSAGVDGKATSDAEQHDNAKVDFLKSLEMVPVDASEKTLNTNQNVEQDFNESDVGSSSDPVAFVPNMPNNSAIIVEEAPQTISKESGGDLKLATATAAAVSAGDSDVFGDVSESDSLSEGTEQTKSKKKLKDEDRKSLLKLISEYYRKRKKEKIESDKDNGSSSGDLPRGRKKRIKSPTKGEREQPGSSSKKAAKRKGSPLKHRKDKAKKRLHRTSDTIIDQSGSSSDEFSKDNLDIDEDSSNSEAQNGDKGHVEANKDTIIDSTDSQESIASNKESVEKGPLNPNDASEEDLEATQLYFKKPAQMVNENNSQNEKTDDESLAESQVVKPYKRASVVPLPTSQSEEGTSEPRSQDSDQTEDQEGSQVVCPFKRKTLQPIPSSETSEFDDSQVIGCKRKVVVPLPSSQSDEDTTDADTMQMLSDMDGEKKKRPHSPTESDSDGTEDISTIAVNGTDDSSSDTMVVASSSKAPDDHHVHKRRKVNSESNKEDTRQAIEVKETDSEDSTPPPVSQFKLDDGGRDDLLEMLDQFVEETHPPAPEADAPKENDVEEVAAEPAPASQFKLCDGDRDNLLNLLTDKEKDETTETSDDKGDEGSKNDEVGLSNADRNELLDLLNDVDKDSDKDSDTSETSDEDEIETIRDSDDKPDDENSDNPDDENTDRFRLDEDERNELLNLLSQHLKDGHSDSSDSEGSGSSSDSGNDDASAGQQRRVSTDNCERFKRSKKATGINRDVLLDLVKEYEEAVTKGTDVNTSDKGLVAIKSDGKMGRFALDMDNGLDLLRNSDADVSSDEDASTDSILLDVLREEAVDENENKKSGSGKSKDDSEEAWNAYQALLDDDEDEISETSDMSDLGGGPGLRSGLLKSRDKDSSDISDMDLDDLELDFAEQERRRLGEARNAELRKRYGIDKELIVDVEAADISGFDISEFQTAIATKQQGTCDEIDSNVSSDLDDEFELDFRSGLFKSRNRDSVSAKSVDMDRLCDLSDVLRKKTSSAHPTKLSRSRTTTSSSDSSHYSSPGRKPGSDWSQSSDSEADDTNQNSFSDPNSPLPRAVSDDEERGRFANALFANIKNSSDENSGLSNSEGGGDSSSDEDEKKKKKRKSISLGANEVKSKKKSTEGDGNSDSGSSSGGSENDSETDNCAESGDQEKKEKVSKEVDLDSSDEEDFVGVRKGRGAWRFDPLLHECLTSDSDEDTDGSGSPKKQLRKRKENKSGRKVEGDSDSDGAKKLKTPVKKLLLSDDSDDSDFEIIEKEVTPQKPILITDDEDTPSKWGKGRRNIRALVQDDELAEATQKAHNEERERIRRLQERDKAKETFTQSQSFSSQLSEDDAEPLILDMNEDIQIKVHPKITQKLKPHQRGGIQFMWDSCYESIKQLKKGWQGSGCILAHCMGLGKTLQALALIQTLFTYSITKTKHVLVVCPLSTVSNWRNEYNLAFKSIKHSHVKLYTIENKKAARRRFDIVSKWWRTGGMLVMGYECFGLLINEQKLDKFEGQTVCHKETILKAMIDPGPDLIICDEGHLLRNKQSQRTLALNRVKTRRRIVLTGTPLQNNLLEYYYMVHFVKPNLLGTEKEYKTNFVNPISNGQFEDSTAEDIMFMKKRTHVLHKLLNRTVQRVEDTELKQYLPKLVDQAVFVKLSDLQVNLYNTYLDSENSRPVVYTKTGNISHKNFLADVQILRYICIHPDVVTTAERTKAKITEQDVLEDNLDDVEEKVFSKGGWYKGLLPPEGSKKLELGSKMVVVLDIVKEAAACGDKVLIFAQSYAEMANLEYFLTEHLKYKKSHDYYRMDGTISPELRTHMCDKFNKKTNTTVKVFIMSTKVGGLGLNLTAANRVIIMNVNWNPSYDTQSVFRSFRFGQKKAVYVYRLIAKDTMEEKMYQRVVTKLAIAHRVVDKHQITRHYSAADIQEFYSVRPTIGKGRPVPNVPEDRVLATLIQMRPFVYRWHEHQALLANRPEEDLDEHQKNAAWEEFNKKEPPPPVPGVPQTILPNYVTASSILGQAGPSGLQNRGNMPVGTQFKANGPVNMQQHKANGQNKVNMPSSNRHNSNKSVAAATRRSERLNKVQSPNSASPSTCRQVFASDNMRQFASSSSLSQNAASNTFSLSLRQTPSGPKLVFLPNSAPSAQATEIPLSIASYAMSPTSPSRTIPTTNSAVPRNSSPTSLRLPLPLKLASYTVPPTSGASTVNSGVLGSDSSPSLRMTRGRTNTIRIINDLMEAQTTSSRIAELRPASGHSSSSEDPNQANGIDELNSLISESLSQDGSWANDGMNDTLASLNFPDSS